MQSRGPRPLPMRPLPGTEIRSGVVLLIVLVAIIIAATTLVSFARNSMEVGADAVKAREELQARWGRVSLRRALLPAADVAFQERDKLFRQAKRELPPPIIQAQVLLGGTVFEMGFADESAKVNINSVYHIDGLEKTRLLVRDLSGSLNGVRLQPEQPPDKTVDEVAIEDGEQPEQPLAFRAWGQVFDLNRIDSLTATTARLTIFSRGAINIRRADEEAAVLAASVVLPKATARRLCREYKKNPDNAVDPLIDRYTSKAAARARLKRLLSDSSVCYSLYVRCRTLNGVRTSFAAIGPDKDGVLRTREFEYRGR